MVDKFTRISCIPGMLIFGTATVTLQKYVFEVKAAGRGGDIHLFKKPWFQTEAIFVGMLSCLIVYEIMRCMRKSKNTQVDDSIQHWKHYFYVAAPAMCDLCATCLMNIGLFYLASSVWQMLRGSMVIFSAILSILFLKKRYVGYHWTGILLVTVGLVTVSFSSFMKDEDESKQATPAQIGMSIALVVGAQIIQASQIVIEEYLLKNVKAAASLIVGLEGMWGGLVGIGVLAIVQNTPTSIPLVEQMFHEDTIDTFYMLGNSTVLLVLIIFYILAILFYNLFGMMVTQTYSAVYRTIMEAVRTMCIWIVNIIIYFFDHSHGEKITWASLVELIGFVILLFGNFLFNKVIRLKCFYYEDTQSTEAVPLVENPAEKSDV